MNRQKVVFIINIACMYVIMALVVASKEIGLEVNAEKTKYMVMSRE
jgi:hypothetical protein